MGWKTLLVSFTVVFLAELGDKTQLMAMALSSSKQDSCWSVFFGSSLALICTSAIAVFTGGILAKYIPQKYILLLSSVLFIMLGVVMLINVLCKSSDFSA